MQEPITLPDSELEVMLVLWRYQEPIRTARILEEVSPEKQWTMSTLKVLLARLEQKQFIECVREGRFTLYRALVPESRYRRKETNGLLARFYQSSAKHMVASLVQDGGLTQEDLKELSEILAKAGETDAP